ncbi:DUF4173 domain-containing protein [Enterococcus sp. BWT-B8]|uniref:DUF4153 domain-containing protein n=1 Tax=Enterococcus sp. BWT-B8 TaxID=2885157 RepID=UPI001E4B2CC3|nr:DUF4173 domain-containing protein [Enterococcus sp. BWT-B8]MCB5952479.1 DUF4173 domain-containing protein [Enterococcus sp. BWT-B8]
MEIHEEDRQQKNWIEQQPKFESKDILLSIASIVIAYFSLQLLKGYGGLWITLFTVLFCGTLLAYIRAKDMEISRRCFGYMGYTLAFGVSFSLFENTVLMGVNFIFLVLNLAYLILVFSGTRKNGKLDGYIVFDFIDGLIVRSFKNFTADITAYLSLGKKHKNLKYVLIGIAMSIPLAVIVLTLLTGADSMFARFFNSFVNRISMNVIEHLITFIIAVPVGIYLFLCIYRNIEKSPVKPHTLSFLKGPDVLFLTILFIFTAIYLLFFGVAAMGYFQFTQSASTTLSAYAREGFFQLLLVSVINVFIFWAINAFSGNSKMIKSGLSLIGVETLGLIVLAFAKMQLYIASFGLTVLRFNTSLFMIALFVCVSIFIAALWKEFNYMRIILVFMSICLLIISCRNTGNDIVSYNYEKYQQGKLSEMDISVFYVLGAEAVPKAVKIYNETTDPELKEELSGYLAWVKKNIEEDSMVRNLQRSRSLALIKQTNK